MKKYEFAHSIQRRDVKVTVILHNTFIACFKAYCEAVYDEGKENRGCTNATSPEGMQVFYEKGFKERGRWAWFQRGRDGQPIINLCVDENEHKGASLCDLTHSLAHELDHFWKGGFFTAAEAEASAVFTGHMAGNALDMSLSIITDRYAKPLIQEICAGSSEELMSDMDTLCRCMHIVHEMGMTEVCNNAWTHDALEERLYAIAVAMIHAREQKRAAGV